MTPHAPTVNVDEAPLPARHLLDNSIYYSFISKYKNFSWCVDHACKLGMYGIFVLVGILLDERIIRCFCAFGLGSVTLPCPDTFSYLLY